MTSLLYISYIKVFDMCSVWYFCIQDKRSYEPLALGARMRTNNKLNPHTCMTPGQRFEPGLHWWEARALITVSSLLPF